jgi:C4-dicarboxylate-specific signal transduction histidine kinase
LILGGYFANLIYPWKTTLIIYFLGVGIYLCLGAYLVYFLPLPYQNLSFSTYVTNAAVISIVALPILFFHTTYLKTVSNLISDLKSKNEILEIRENELSTYKNKLEKLVYERTNELEEANRKLKKESINLEESYRSLKDTQQQLVRAEKMASLGVLIAGIGHEINNPLNYIKGGIDGIKQFLKNRKLDIDRETSEYIKIMDEGVDRAAAILKGLSHAARQTDTMMESCNIHQILDNTLLILNNSFKEKITLHKDYCEDEIVVRGNDGKLHQLFINIITNAEQAIEKSGEIKIRTTSSNDYAEITIEDNGVGISKENINKIADPFFTTKDPGVGTGLGMYIANSIVEEHGGSWEIDSEENKGTKVIIRIPA